MASIAFLSTAHIHTQGFIDNIRQAGDGRSVCVVWDDDEDRGRRYAGRAEAPFEPDLEAVLRNPAVDGFIICAEHTRHLRLLRAVLPLGKPVFCEKPLVTSPEDLAEVSRLIAAHPQTALFCGYFQPFEAGMRTISRLVAEEAFGRITRIRYRNAHHAAYGRWFDHPDLAWFHQPELSGGGAFMDMGTHALHLVRTLFGPVDSVLAEIGNHAGIYPQCDDYGIALLRFSNGILGTVEASWTQTGGIGGLEIVGSQGALWNTPSGYVRGAPGSKPEPLPITAESKPTRVDRLVAVIRGTLPTDELAMDLAATRDTVSVMAAAYRSAQTGGWQEVAGDRS